MNARDGMRRIREERRRYHLCIRCGKRLPREYKRKTCTKCLKRELARQKSKSCISEDNNAESSTRIKS